MAGRRRGRRLGCFAMRPRGLGHAAMSDLTALRPTKSRRVMDLVHEAGVDISDWPNFEGGASKAASNPRYCYDWSFVQPGKVVVLNVWYRAMVERRGVITLQDNFRASAAKHSRGRRG